VNDDMARSSGRIRVLIADDHPMFRDGLRKLLQEEPVFEVVGMASDGEEALRLARRLKPAVILLDLAMPLYAGRDALRDLAALPSVYTIVLTAAMDKKQIVDVLQRGARGVVSKESAVQLLIRCIHQVVAGEYWVGRDTVASIVQALRSLKPPPAGRATDKPFGITPHELEIVSGVAAGATNKHIAEKLSISEQTVKHRLTSIFDKCGVSRRVELARFAANHRLLSQGQPASVPMRVTERRWARRAVSPIGQAKLPLPAGGR
jgi:two-component system, NarL family, nitrate/nitrite response regulator NarL